jgi:hypothetical protein
VVTFSLFSQQYGPSNFAGKKEGKQRLRRGGKGEIGRSIGNASPSGVNFVSKKRGVGRKGFFRTSEQHFFLVIFNSLIAHTPDPDPQKKINHWMKNKK